MLIASVTLLTSLTLTLLTEKGGEAKEDDRAVARALQPGGAAEPGPVPEAHVTLRIPEAPPPRGRGRRSQA